MRQDPGKPSFYWHDYETFGTHPGVDRPAQFAGIRTDMDFNIIDEPLMLYCQPADDYLPQPQACLVTGISPQHCLQHGVPEYRFFQQIHQQLSQANTCTAGYNNLRFDDEFTRFGFYRNFIDVYGREWQNGNSRWDIIDLLRMTAALRPQGINWPVNERGYISFRLEKLTQANDIGHQHAHDALADVYATIAMAKLVREKQPRLFDFYFQLRNKHRVLELIQLQAARPLLHTSGKISGEFGHTSIILPLMQHPVQGNAIICYDLRYPPDELFEMSAEEIRQRLYTRIDELGEQQRIALKLVHINKCPALAPLNTLTDAAAEHCQIKLDEQLSHVQALEDPALRKKISNVFEQSFEEQEQDADLSLYRGGFFSPADQNRIRQIQQAGEQELQYHFGFDDPRLEVLFFRYKARNFPHLLDTQEQQQWQDFKIQRLCREDTPGLTLSAYYQQIKELLETDLDSEKIRLLQQLQQYPQEYAFPTC